MAVVIHLGCVSTQLSRFPPFPTPKSQIVINTMLPQSAPRRTATPNKLIFTQQTDTTGRPMAAASSSSAARMGTSAPPAVDNDEILDPVAVAEQLNELREENAKLRDIEAQFWLLLDERELLQKELDDIRQATKTTKPVTTPSNGTAAANMMDKPPDLKLQAEYEAMVEALRECMDMLLTREGKQATAAQGPVAAFLQYVSTAAGTNVPPPLTAVAPGALSDVQSKVVGLETENETLKQQLRTCKEEVKQLQEEIDRTDMSRLQALEDAERLQKQLEVLSEQVRELRTAYATVKAQADSQSKGSTVVAGLKKQLEEKNAEILRLKAQSEQLQRLSDVGGMQLAADAARIRSELAARSQGRAPSS